MKNEVVKYEQVKDRIITLRGVPVLLDADVAQLYGVETKRVNEAVKNNPDKFPEGFLFSLSDEEKTEVVENFDHLQKLKFSPVNPTAFTESGLYMLATILKSPRATQTTIAIIKTFVQLRAQDQMTELFQRDKSTISRHIKNIFEDGELEEKSVVAFFATTASDGKTYQVAYYNLDVIISVGYRVKSKREYPIVNTLRSQLNWSQYRSLIQIPNPNAPRYDSI